jgi:antitoxin PrlF
VQDRRIPATKVAEQMLTRPGGATMAEIIAATGGPQYNQLKKLKARGYGIRELKEGRQTRYFAEPPAAPYFEAAVTSQGQVTIPKEVRERLGVRPGGKLRFTLEDRHRVVLTAAGHSILDLVGILPKPKRAMTIKEMDEAIGRAAVERYLRSTR